MLISFLAINGSLKYELCGNDGESWSLYDAANSRGSVT